jgi:hypothetical protein
MNGREWEKSASGDWILEGGVIGRHGRMTWARDERRVEEGG